MVLDRKLKNFLNPIKNSQSNSFVTRLPLYKKMKFSIRDFFSKCDETRSFQLASISFEVIVLKKILILVVSANAFLYLSLFFLQRNDLLWEADVEGSLANI